MLRRALKCHEVKENSKGIKSVLGRIAIIKSAAREGLSNKAAFEKTPEVRALCIRQYMRDKCIQERETGKCKDPA